MPFSTDPALDRLIKQRFPAAKAAGSVSALRGLSGFSQQVTLADRQLLARRVANGLTMPGVDRQREYRLLRKLSASGLTPAVWGRNADWLLLGWQPGEVLRRGELDHWLEPLVDEVVRLHHQPLSGYRLQLLPLLMSYWQRSQPRRRSVHWLRALQQLRRQREPRPLRLAVLHMDIHSDNLVVGSDSGRLRLIDWEYAADGDVALELAAIISGNALDAQQQQRVIAHYARRQQLDPDRLQRQVARWQPWLLLLATSWYELRAQQSGEQHFYTLAAEGWQRLQNTR